MHDCDLFILKGCCCSIHGCLKPEPYFKYNSAALCMYKSLMNTCDMTFDLRRPRSYLIRVTAPSIPPTHLIIQKRFAGKKLPFYERSKQAAGKQPRWEIWRADLGVDEALSLMSSSCGLSNAVSATKMSCTGAGKKCCHQWWLQLFTLTFTDRPLHGGHCPGEHTGGQSELEE